MNVCVVAEYYPRRRDPVLGVWAHEQALAARAAGADIRVLTLERPVPPMSALKRPRELVASLRGFVRQPRHEQRDGLEVEHVRFLAPPRDTSYAEWDRWARRPLERALDRLDRSRRIDAVHAHYALPAGAAARGWAARNGRPLLVSIHGGDVYGPLLSAPAARARVADVLRGADAVLCNSAETLARAARITGSPERMRVVHLGARAPSGAPPRRERRTVASLGQVVPRKRHEDVIRALADPRLADVGWVVIGDGPERPRLERIAVELGLADRTEWLGALTHEAALRELARCHVMALPSVDEAFGVAYIEAMACGLPAVGSAGEGGPEEISAVGDGMRLVPPRDPPALAAVLAALLSDPPGLERLGAAARRTAADHFSWEECGRATVAAYRETLAG